MKYILILITLFLVSCGARKVQKNTSIEENVKLTSVNVADTSSTKISKQDNTIINLDVITEETTISPADTSKQMIVDGKEYKNVIIKKNKKTDKSITNLNKKESTVSSSASKGRSIHLDVKNAKVDIVSKEREEPVQFYVYAFVFILLLVIISWLYKKYIKLF